MGHGGAPKASESANMRRAELMAAAKGLGVETRRAGADGEKTCGDQGRTCVEITRRRQRLLNEGEAGGAAGAMMEEQARLCQPPEASQPSQGSDMANSSVDEVAQEAAERAEIARDRAEIARVAPRAPNNHDQAGCKTSKT